MLENVAFTYDGIHSSDMKVVQVNVSSSLFEEAFLPTREIREEYVRGREKPYFLGYDISPFEFPLTLYFDDLTSEDKRKIARWLFVDYYKPLIFDSNPERIFYCMYVGDTREIHNGLNQGYLTLNMRCDSPFSYSPVYTTDVYDFSDNGTDGTEIEFANYGDDMCEPIVLLEVVEEGDFSIINMSDGGREMKLMNLLDGDELTIDCEHEDISSPHSGYFDYNNSNGTFLRFVTGVNRLKVYGKCRLQFKYEFKIYQG